MKLLSTLVLISALIALTNCVPSMVVGAAQNAVALLFKQIIKSESEGGKKIAGSFIKSMSPVLKILKIDIDEGYEEQLNRIEENIERGFNTTYKRIDYLQTLMKRSFDALATDVKFSSLRLLQVDIETDYHNFLNLIDGYGSNATELLPHLNKFVVDYNRRNYEQKLVNLLSAEAYSSESIIDALITSVKANSEKMFNKKKTSPNRLVYDFYQSILFMIYKGNLFLSSCYQIRNHLTNSTSTLDQKFIATRLSRAVDDLYKLIRAKSADLDNESSLLSYVDLSIASNQKKLGFQNVLQQYVQLEESMADTCSQNCAAIQNKYIKFAWYNNHKCQGSVRNCRYASASEQVFYSSDPDRIYDVKQNEKGDNIAFIRGSTWMHGPPGQWYDCDVCYCYCDQYQHPLTQRSVYTGEMSPSDLRHVITGFRFRQEQHVIYLQIQVGHFLKDGSIDIATVHWQEAPHDLTEKNVEINYDDRQILLNDLHFADAVLTGIQFVKRSDNIIGMNIFGRKVEEHFGELEAKRQTLYKDSKAYNHENIYVRNAIPGLNNEKADDEGSFKTSQKSKFANVIQFETSRMEADMGQTLLPQFSAEDVVPDVPIPLSGIGLMHFTNDNNYGGFIKPFYMTYNFVRLLQTAEIVAENAANVDDIDS